MCGGIRVSSVYVPNGRSLDDDHYQYKLRWLAQLRQHVAALSSPDDAVIVAGDFNIAPDDIDVYDPAKFVGATHTSPPERALLAELSTGAWSTCSASTTPTASCTAGGTTGPATSTKVVGCASISCSGQRSVAERCTWSMIDRNARKGQMPSDHAPVIVELD